jgi:CheY-like chemotaxis protein
MPDGGNLCLKVARIQISSDDSDRLLYLRTGLHAIIEVSDTGTGMDERTQKRLFEPFYTTKKAGKGTGLGLATVMSIVKHHGGHIVVKSTIGQGTTFMIYLPATEKQEPISRAEKELVSHGTRCVHTGKVLLVDDEEVFLNSARRLLEGLGYFVVTAKDGGEAVHHFAADNESIELVLLDLVMPNMGGAETLYALREIDPEVKILLSSGRTELGGVRDLLAAGAQGFLQKPYDAGALGEAISRVLFNSTPIR